jgi:Glycosyl hydrolase family 26
MFYSQSSMRRAAIILAACLVVAGSAYGASRLSANRLAASAGPGSAQRGVTLGEMLPGPRAQLGEQETSTPPRGVAGARPAPASESPAGLEQENQPAPRARRVLRVANAIGVSGAPKQKGDDQGQAGAEGHGGPPAAIADLVAEQPTPGGSGGEEEPEAPGEGGGGAPEAPIGSPDSIYWGAAIGDPRTGQQAPWAMNLVTEFEGAIGKPLSLIHLYSPFADCSRSPCSFYRFPSGAMENVRSYGAIPFFSWASQSTPSSLNEPAFQLRDVVAGTYDAFIREFAQAARQWGHPFFLRFNWEMNGNWFPWSEGVNGNGPSEFVAAWRHVHDIFSAAGARNATWVWCPNIDPDGVFQDSAATYPGDAYVDWTCLDGFNWGTYPERPDRWRTFDELFSSSYHHVTDEIAPSKPMIIGEVASSEYGGSKAEWIREMLVALPESFPKVRGLLWFDQSVEGDWPLSTSSSATDAFANAIRSPVFTENEFADLPTTAPVEPPG